METTVTRTPDSEAPAAPVGAFFLRGVGSGQSGGASLREGVLAVAVAEWTRDIALILSGVAGLLHWAWWVPLLCGASATLMREASQGFLLTQQCGSGYLIRSITTMCLFCGAVAAGAYALSTIYVAP